MFALRWLGIVIGGLLTLLVVVTVVARLSDGPLAIFAGGPLVAGELVTERDVDWTFATDIAEIEFQLVEPPRSRTVWLIVHEGSLYIPCGFLDVPLWKQWPHEAEADGRSILRIDGKLYERQAVRVHDADERQAVFTKAAAKYGFAEVTAAPDPDEFWLFRMDPPAG